MRALAPLLAALVFALGACPSAPDPRGDATGDPRPQAVPSVPAPATGAPDAEAAREARRKPVRRRITRAGSLKMPARVEPKPGQIRQLRLAGLNDFASWTRADPKLARALERASFALPRTHLANSRLARRFVGELDLRVPASCTSHKDPPPGASDLHPAQRCTFALRDEQSAGRIWLTLAQDDQDPQAARWVIWRDSWAWLEAQAAVPGTKDLPDGASAYALTTFFESPALNLAEAPAQAPPAQAMATQALGDPNRRDATNDPGLELRWFGAAGLARLRSEVRELLGLGAIADPTLLDPLLDPLLATLGSQIGPQIDQLIARVTLVGPRPTLDLALRWLEGSAIERASLASTTHALPTGLLRDIPPNSIAFVFVGIDLEHWLLHFTRGPRPSPLTQAIATALAIDAQQFHESANAYAQQAQQIYAPTLGVVVDRRASGGPSLTVVRKLRGESARPRWLAWARAQAQAQPGSFELQEAVQHLDGHLVDRLRLRLPPAVSAGSRELGGAFARLGEAIVIERVEVADYVVWGIDAQARPDLNRRWVEWLTRPFNKRSWHHLGSFARHPAGMALVGGLNLSLLSRSLGGRMLVGNGSLDDLRLLASPLAPSDLVMRLQASLELVHYLGDESPPVAFGPPVAHVDP